MIGTRPEAVKLAPVIWALRRSTLVQVNVAVTAQQPTLALATLAEFGIAPETVLNAPPKGNPTRRVGIMAANLAEHFGRTSPVAVVVHGDTGSAVAGAMAGAYDRRRVLHVEAGLRTFCWDRPFPEEINRKVVSVLARRHYAPTALNRENLAKEGVSDTDICVTGNPGIDSLKWALKDSARPTGPHWVPKGRRIIVVTQHRKENIGEPMQNVLAGVGDALRAISEPYSVVMSLHPNPEVRRIGEGAARLIGNCQVCEPVSYRAFARLLRAAALIVTDSGGIQEEATYLDRPVVITRDVTERPEALAPGRRVLAGTTREVVAASIRTLIARRQPISRAVAKATQSVFGTGDAGAAIANDIIRLVADERASRGRQRERGAPRHD
ncbi:MAG: non-hydrolyzing UDP-N-acetylglucosamine 2-epimerase [Gemmatimonadaceae bacterium]